MKRILSATLFCVLAAGTSDAFAADSRHTVDTIAVQSDGTVTWNLLPMKSNKELIQKLRRARAIKSDVHVKAASNARFEAVARVVAIMQREGVGKIGFITSPR
ncbi:MAG TPA: biopolymer transporter ExbD [Rhizomicrobium sp.]|jgi:biopolymer transport protein ExbD|nr:biopolymer transporter ExbD [Rhizomicrobium sp.]